MITVYLRNGDIAEVNAERIESQIWSFADGSAAASLACLDEEGEIVGQFLVDQIAGWMFSVEDIFNFTDDDDDDEDEVFTRRTP